MTAPGSGAEIIPFLKTWVNLPAAIGFTILYAKVCPLFCASVCISCIAADERESASLQADIRPTVARSNAVPESLGDWCC